MNYRAEHDTHFQHNRDDSHTRTDYIRRICFESSNFSIDFCPRGYDYDIVKQFVTDFLSNKDCKLELFDETSIDFIVDQEMVKVKLHWPTRPGTLIYKSLRGEWIDAFKKLSDDMKAYVFR